LRRHSRGQKIREIFIIVKKDIKEALRSKLMLLNIVAGAGLIYYLTISGYKSVTIIQNMRVNGTAADLNSYLQSILGTNLFMVFLAITIIYSQVFSGYSLLIDKMKRSLESLLCTPLSLAQFCCGKILSVFIPSVVLGILFTVLSYCVTNIYIISPDVGHWVIPGFAYLLATLIGAPLVIMFLTTLFQLLQLITSSVRVINGIFIVVALATLFGFAVAPVFSLSSWSIAFISLSVVAALGLADLLLFRLLTKERIILSSKG
jgi:ABC-2 type transport system permease protein